MTTLTAANQLTLLRMLLIPAFVILVVYGHLGYALAVFVTAGVTDGLDGLATGASTIDRHLPGSAITWTALRLHRGV